MSHRGVVITQSLKCMFTLKRLLQIRMRTRPGSSGTRPGLRGILAILKRLLNSKRLNIYLKLVGQSDISYNLFKLTNAELDFIPPHAYVASVLDCQLPLFEPPNQSGTPNPACHPPHKVNHEETNFLLEHLKIKLTHTQ